MNEVAPGLVTVFGGSGFVGSQVVQALAKRGWRVRIACRRPDLAWKLQTSGTVGQLQSVRCDVTRPEEVAAALRGADAA
ncbi:MAG: NAD(P)H-binding protein, partial [Brevundimonas sp.]